MVNPIVLGEYIEAAHRVGALGATESFLLANRHHDTTSVLLGESNCPHRTDALVGFAVRHLSRSILLSSIESFQVRFTLWKNNEIINLSL